LKIEIRYEQKCRQHKKILTCANKQIRFADGTKVHTNDEKYDNQNE
jgi:hypothetical protein